MFRWAALENPPRSAGSACSLCSGAADFVNGTTIEIDGGMLPGVLYDAGLKTFIRAMAVSDEGISVLWRRSEGGDDPRP
jgi:hypothetical protein